MPSLLQDPIFSNIYHGSHQSSNIFKGGPCSTSSLLQDGMHLALIPLVITERKKFHYKESNNRAHTRLGRNYTDYYSEELQELVSYKRLQEKNNHNIKPLKPFQRTCTYRFQDTRLALTLTLQYAIFLITHLTKLSKTQ